MIIPTINELARENTFDYNWQGASAIRNFQIIYESTWSGQAGEAIQRLKEYLLTESYIVYIGANGYRVPCYPEYAGMLIQSVSLSQEGLEPKYVATVTYGTASFGSGGVFPPWWFPWKLGVSFMAQGNVPLKGGIVKIEKSDGIVYEVDPRVFMTKSPRTINGVDYIYDEAKQNVLLNSADTLFDNPIQEDLYIMQIHLQGARDPNYGLLTGQLLGSIIGSLNADTVVIAGDTWAPGSLCIKNIRSDNQAFESTVYQDITIELEAHPSGHWYNEVLDQGPLYQEPTYDYEYTGPGTVTVDKEPYIPQEPPFTKYKKVNINNGGTITTTLVPWTYTEVPFETDGEKSDIQKQLNGKGQPRGWNYETDSIDEEEKMSTDGPCIVTWCTKPFIFFDQLQLPQSMSGIW